MIETVIIVLPLMLSPGPANLVSFALAARFGLSQMLFFLLGIALVYALLAIGLGVLTNQVTEQASNLAVALKIFGGLFIFYLGVRLIRRENHSISIKAPSFSNGVLLQLLNPKYPPVVLSVFAHNQNQPALFTAGVISLIGVLGLIMYAVAGTFIHRQSNSDRWFRPLDIVFGVMLCLIGLWLLVEPIGDALINNAT